MYKKYFIVLVNLLLMLDCYSQNSDYQVVQKVEGCLLDVKPGTQRQTA